MSSNDNAPLLEPLRFSRLKWMGKSAAHFAVNPTLEGDGIEKGSATHSFLLGDADKVVTYAKARNKKHKAYREFLEAHPVSEVLTPKQFADACGMRDAILAHPRARKLLQGIRENRITWDMVGRACAGTPDVVHLTERGKVLVELKTAQCSAPGLFRWQGKKLGYPAQLAWYADGLERTMDYRPGDVVEIYVVAVESTKPYNVVVYPVTERLRAQGRRQYRLWFEQLLNCERTGIFPGYAESDVEWDAEDEALQWEDDDAAA